MFDEHILKEELKRLEELAEWDEHLWAHSADFVRQKLEELNESREMG